MKPPAYVVSAPDWLAVTTGSRHVNLTVLKGKSGVGDVSADGAGVALVDGLDDTDSAGLVPELVQAVKAVTARINAVRERMFS